MATALTFVVPAGAALVRAAREVRLLGALTPLEAAKERARLAGVLESGGEPRPRWTYSRVDRGALRRELEGLHEVLADECDEPLLGLYRARLQELALDAEMAEAAGTSHLAALACRRFGKVSRRANALAARWFTARQPHGPSDVAPTAWGHPKPQALRSDAPDARSLVARMRAEVGRLRLPFVVRTCEELAPLAAVGERDIWVASGREVTPEDVERTVLHEVHGHALPRARAAASGSAVLIVGTARGADDQEGYALVLEERAGLSTPRRRRQLALRHEVAARMRAGESFGAVARWLACDAGLAADDAVRTAERAWRGSSGDKPGLGRESIYLETYVRVRDALRARPRDETVIASGQVAVSAVSAVRSCLEPRD